MNIRIAAVACIALAMTSMTACTSSSSLQAEMGSGQNEFSKLKREKIAELDRLYDQSNYVGGHTRLEQAVRDCKTIKDRAGMAGKSITAMSGLAAVTKVMNVYWAGGLTLFATALNYIHDTSPISATDVQTTLEKHNQEYIDARGKMNTAENEADLDNAFEAGKIAVGYIRSTLAIELPSCI